MKRNIDYLEQKFIQKYYVKINQCQQKRNRKIKKNVFLQLGRNKNSLYCKYEIIDLIVLVF